MNTNLYSRTLVILLFYPAFKRETGLYLYIKEKKKVNFLSLSARKGEGEPENELIAGCPSVTETGNTKLNHKALLSVIWGKSKTHQTSREDSDQRVQIKIKIRADFDVSFLSKDGKVIVSMCVFLSCCCYFSVSKHHLLI